VVAAESDLEASHGLLTDAQARAWRRIVAGLAGTAPLDVLDIGCGTGFLSFLLAAQDHRVTGVDIASTMLARAREKAIAQRLAIRSGRRARHPIGFLVRAGRICLDVQCQRAVATKLSEK
jgi:cyclopropane fatty-acyl-phospholipid synthase-like methyltransferase